MRDFTITSNRSTGATEFLEHTRALANAERERAQQNRERLRLATTALIHMLLPERAANVIINLIFSNDLHRGEPDRQRSREEEKGEGGRGEEYNARYR